MPGAPYRRLCGVSWGLWEESGLSTRGREPASRRVPRGERDKIQQGRHTVQEPLHGAGTREVQEDTVLVLFDLRCHFEEGEDQRRGLGLGQRGMLEGMGAQGVMQDIGRTGQQEPHSIGGLDHGVGHSLLLLYDAKALNGQKSKEFKGLYHYTSNIFLSLF